MTREQQRNDYENGIVAVSDDDSFTYSLDSINSRCGFPTEFVFNVDPTILVDRRDIKIGKILGEGPNSVVYEGLYNSRAVAVKIIQPVKASDVCPNRKEMFQREVMLLSNMKHEGVVKFVGATVDPTLMVITELMRGGTLQRHLASTRPTPLDLKLALTYALDISKAMEFLHARGVIHRDLKPSNILLNKDKTRVKLADFGLAREVSGDMTTEAGTYRWMAPELFSTDPYAAPGTRKRYDHKVDVYSFSIVLWELMANETPFKGRNSIMVAYATSKKMMRPGIESIPKELAPLVQSCWSDDPKYRPEFRDITEYLHTLYYSLYPPEVRPRPQPASKVFDIGIPGLDGAEDGDYFCYDSDTAVKNDDSDHDEIVEIKDEIADPNENDKKKKNKKKSEDDKTVAKKSKPFFLFRCFSF